MKYVLCAIFLLACNLIYAGEYDGEISSYKNLLDGAKKGESQTYIDFIKKRLNFYEELNQAGKEETVFKKYVKDKDTEMLVRETRMEFLFKRKNYKGALEEFERWIKILENNKSWLEYRDCEMYRKAGYCCYFLGEYQKAIDYYNKALEDAEKQAEGIKERKENMSGITKAISRIYLDLAWNYIAMGEYLNGITYANRSIKDNKEESEGYFCRGEAKLKLGDFDGAIQDYRKCGDLGSAYAFKRIGEVEKMRRDFNNPAINTYNSSPTLGNIGNGHGSIERYLDDISNTLKRIEWILTDIEQNTNRPIY